MILKTLLDYLNASSTLTVSAYAETPETLPASYVLLEQIAGSEENQILTTRIAVRSIAPTLYNAAVLNETVKSLMGAAVSLGSVCKVELNSNYNDTDTQTKQYAYEAVFDVTHYKN